MRSQANLLRLSLIVLLLVSLAAGQSEPPITADRVMTGEELRATGVGTLTSAQRAALDRWLSAYTRKILEFAQQGVDKPADSGTGNYTGSGRGHWIKSKSGNGSIIVLEDSSIWEIDSIDRIDTMLWLPMTDITILKADSPVRDYKYILINMEDGYKALARFSGKK